MNFKTYLKINKQKFIVLKKKKKNVFVLIGKCPYCAIVYYTIKKKTFKLINNKILLQ